MPGARLPRGFRLIPLEGHHLYRRRAHAYNAHESRKEEGRAASIPAVFPRAFSPAYDAQFT